MNSKKHVWTLYLIIATIVMSIVVQVYFNYRNYQENKKLFFNEVQSSLDNATDIYFSNLAKNKFLFNKENFKPKEILTIIIEDDGKGIDLKDSIIVNGFPEIKNNEIRKLVMKSEKSTEVKTFFLPSKSKDSLKLNIESIFYALQAHKIDFKKLNILINKELERKKIKLNYSLNHYNKEGLLTSNGLVEIKNPIKTQSKSTYLKQNEKIELVYPNQTKTILRNGLVGIFLSFLFSLAIISSLFYLLNIIKKQKQIAEIKNDFINNITHEFKTPIATIGIANEAMRNFDILKDKAKTDEYLEITNNQVKKLHVMVEKVLETSILDSEKLLLQKGKTDITTLISRVVIKHQLTSPNKELKFTQTDTIFENVDAFHFENVINNLIDNAVKYGGDLIELSVQKNDLSTTITITDSGSIEKPQKEKIFHKFYRIPKGNKHDVKGFGIGLYYAKKIIEKHGGTLEILDAKITTFKIQINH